MKQKFLDWFFYSCVAGMFIAILLWLVGESDLLSTYWYLALAGAMGSGFIVQKVYGGCRKT